ncbi:uncharacterized protein YifB [Paenibacillus polymyxa M1]|uniref:YifB n=1 Tax=Paenibacillus polymyxa (strain SC2) TaxID=886882 RepID=E3EG12_PAEPS|nr:MULTISPECIES: ATP-binding protein [Paenibacillus]ADO56045.1 yifB [Paenibacillus polymyxa SC2]MBU9707458.1 ATP-binding protein [Paenibacillus sp. AK121]OAZ47969.1 hypothetical protein A9Z39_17035 [Paenibacillus polymyxa]QOH61623.1 hypothetical protein DI243_09465 [Paenibacillus polymyxa]CCC84805.1 uncharacterized protein YifB [Paenibacillus polymyxa M1]
MEDYSDVLGQLHAKRALVIAAARMHNILLIHKSVKFTVSGSSPIVQLSVILFVLTEFLDLHL